MKLDIIELNSIMWQSTKLSDLTPRVTKMYLLSGFHTYAPNRTKIDTDSADQYHFPIERNKLSMQFIYPEGSDIVGLSDLKPNCQIQLLFSNMKSMDGLICGGSMENFFKYYSGISIKIKCNLSQESDDKYIHHIKDFNRILKNMFLIWAITNGLTSSNWTLPFCNKRFILYYHYFHKKMDGRIEYHIFVWDRLHNNLIQSNGNLCFCRTKGENPPLSPFWKFLFYEDVYYNQFGGYSHFINYVFDNFNIFYVPIYGNAPSGVLFPQYCKQKECITVLKKGIFAWSNYKTIDDYPFISHHTEKDDSIRQNFCQSHDDYFCLVDETLSLVNITDKIKNLAKLRFYILLLLTDATPTASEIGSYCSLDEGIQHFIPYIFHEGEELRILQKLSSSNGIAGTDWTWWMSKPPYFNVHKLILELTQHGIMISGIEHLNTLTKNLYFNKNMLPFY